MYGCSDLWVMSRLWSNRISFRGKVLVKKTLIHSKDAYALGGLEKQALFGGMFFYSVKRVYMYMYMLNGQLKSHSEGCSRLGLKVKLFWPYVTAKWMGSMFLIKDLFSVKASLMHSLLGQWLIWNQGRKSLATSRNKVENWSGNCIPQKFLHIKFNSTNIFWRTFLCKTQWMLQI